MSFIVDPESGALVSDLDGKAKVDARVRLLTLHQSRPILTSYGIPWMLASRFGDSGEILSLQGYAISMLTQSPFYTVGSVRITLPPDRDIIKLDAALTLLDGQRLDIGIGLTPQR